MHNVLLSFLTLNLLKILQARTPLRNRSFWRRITSGIRSCNNDLKSPGTCCTYNENSRNWNKTQRHRRKMSWTTPYALWFEVLYTRGWTGLSFFIAQGDASLQNYNFIALQALMTCRWATLIYFCSFQMLWFKYQVGLCCSPLPAKKITFRKIKKGKVTCLGVWYCTSSLQMLKTTQKSRFPLEVLFGTLVNVLSRIWGLWWRIYEWIRGHLPSLQSTSSVFPRRPFQTGGDTPNRRRKVKRRSVWLLWTWIVGYGGDLF